jgi:sulfane dehydrogenase subunit SoxC
MTSDSSSHPAGRRLRRRAFLTGAALSAASLATGPVKAGEVIDTSRAQGDSIVSPPYGVPSKFEANVIRRPRATPPFSTSASSNTPLQKTYGIITPTGLHYERHHAGVPQISPDTHRLLVHGLVDRPLVFTMDDIVRFPSVSRIHFLECSGNSPLWSNADKNWTAQETHGLLSGAEWTGVPVSTILAEVGLKPEAKWVLAEGADGASMTRSIPIEKLLDDAILAYAQNGERLRPEQGYPLRLFLPGFEGNISVKWLHRLKVAESPFYTREETSKYTDFNRDGKATRFNFIMDVKSVVLTPSGGDTVTGAGFREIAGLAWSGLGRIRKVEVTLDGGQSWQEAELQEPRLPKALTRFRLPWRWDGAPFVVGSRAEDEFGNVQPTHAALTARRGVASRYHYNAIHYWRLESDGKVRNAV